MSVSTSVKYVSKYQCKICVSKYQCQQWWLPQIYATKYYLGLSHYTVTFLVSLFTFPFSQMCTKFLINYRKCQIYKCYSFLTNHKLRFPFAKWASVLLPSLDKIWKSCLRYQIYLTKFFTRTCGNIWHLR